MEAILDQVPASPTPARVLVPSATHVVVV